MFKIRLRPSNKNFTERFVRMLVFFGIPMCLFELIGAPRHLWVSILEFVIPPIVAGVFFITLIVHLIMRMIRRREQNSREGHEELGSE